MLTILVNRELPRQVEDVVPGPFRIGILETGLVEGVLVVVDRAGAHVNGQGVQLTFPPLLIESCRIKILHLHG